MFACAHARVSVCVRTFVRACMRACLCVCVCGLASVLRLASSIHLASIWYLSVTKMTGEKKKDLMSDPLLITLMPVSEGSILVPHDPPIP